MQANYYIHSKQIGLHKREAYYEQRKDEEFSHVSSELKNQKVNAPFYVCLHIQVYGLLNLHDLALRLVGLSKLCTIFFLK